jgi:hypothetical protein
VKMLKRCAAWCPKSAKSVPSFTRFRSLLFHVYHADNLKGLSVVDPANLIMGDEIGVAALREGVRVVWQGGAGVVTRLSLVLLALDRHQGAREEAPRFG